MAAKKSTGFSILGAICGILAYLVFKPLFLLNALPIPFISVVTLLVVCYLIWVNYKTASVGRAFYCLFLYLLIYWLFMPIFNQIISAFSA
jgi:hypothetical protein